MIPKISVILTTFNSAAYIERTIRSILQQDGAGDEFEIELIVADDCSTDATQDIIENLGLSYLSTGSNSGGPNRGRNLGIKSATGDYLCISDHDDEWYPHRVRSVLPFLDKVPIVTSGYTVVDAQSGKQDRRACNSEKGYREFPENATFLKKLCKSKGGQNTYLGSIFYANSLQHILFEERFGVVDFDWISRLFYMQPSIEVCDSLYARHVDGTNLSLDETYRKNDLEYTLKLIETYRDQYPDHTKLAYERVHGSMGRYYYVMGNMKEARRYLKKAGKKWKILAYYATSYVGSGIVKKFVKVFG